MRTQVYKYEVICGKKNHNRNIRTLAQNIHVLLTIFFKIVAKIQYIITTLLMTTFFENIG